MTDDDILARLEHYERFLDPTERARLHASLDHPRLPAIRINTLKITCEKALHTWPDWYGWAVKPVPFCAAGWQITAQAQPIGDTLEFHNGYYYIQDAASMLPAEMFSDHETPLILDMAAAPGGKTTHLASRFEDQGVILANDTSAKRIAALRANLQNWGVFGALVTNYPGERLGQWFPETFDRVLVDAPCSGDTLRITTGRRTRTVSDRERGALCQRQNALLLSAFQAVRPGGEVVYSTCTMSPEEDEAVLDELLRRYPQQAVIDPIEHLPVATPGLESDGSTPFHPQVRHAIRLWPHYHQTSGFFAARIRKTDVIPVESEPPPSRVWEQSGLIPVPRKIQAQMIDGLAQDFGFALDTIIDTRKLILWQRDRLIYALPERLVESFAGLPLAAAGLMIGQIDGDRFIPSHEFITAFETQFTCTRLTLANDQRVTWLEGRDLRNVPDLPYTSGSVILLEDERGRFLGRGKVLRDRIRNLLPKRIIT
jgi:16S rRNA (cytosine1407-C5)-methyltransferase